MDVTNEIRDRIRSAFPALAGDTVFMENASGSQVPESVADAIHRYMLSSYVQLGAGYSMSQQATRVVDDAHDFVRMLFNGSDGEVILGSSTSAHRSPSRISACTRRVSISKKRASTSR